MKRGDEFPPVIAHGKMGKPILADGNHRLQAAIKAKRPLRRTTATVFGGE